MDRKRVVLSLLSASHSEAGGKDHQESETSGWDLESRMNRQAASNHPVEGRSSLHHPAATSCQHSNRCLRFVTDNTQTSMVPSDNGSPYM